jgi:hypothetical protein
MRLEVVGLVERLHLVVEDLLKPHLEVVEVVVRHLVVEEVYPYPNLAFRLEHRLVVRLVVVALENQLVLALESHPHHPMHVEN